MNRAETKKTVERIPFYVRLSMKEQVLFAKRLSFLIKGGVPILKGLNIIRKQTRSPFKQKIFDQIINDVANGQFLAKSLEKFKRIFGDFAINIIRVGEMSGVLENNLIYLAEELQKKHNLRRKVIGSLIYPVFITVATLGVVGLLTVFIFPKLLPIFQSLNVQLPFTTKILIIISSFLLHYGLWVILGIIILVIAFIIVYKKNRQVKFWTHKIIIWVPFSGQIVKSYNMTNFCRTLGLLLKSDVKLIQALSITAETTGNLVYKKEIEKMSKSTVRGERISKHLEENPKIFPSILAEMVSMGEATGNLSDTLMYLSDLYENELDDLTKNLSNSVEPVLMIFMGLAVGIVAVSIITPIYDITQNLQPK